MVFIFVNTTQYPFTLNNKHTPFKQAGNTTIFSFGYQYLVTCWSILLTKPMFSLYSRTTTKQWSWFGCCSWIYISTLFLHRANLLGSQDSEEAMQIGLLLFHSTTVKVTPTLLVCLMYYVQSDHVPFFLQMFVPNDSAFA